MEAPLGSQRLPYSTTNDERTIVVRAISNVLDPLAGRTVRELPAGRTAREYALEFWPLLPPGRAINVAIDGQPAALDAVPKPGQSLLLAVAPKGGGGGSKNVFSTVGMIALMVAAPAVGSMLGNALFYASPSAFGSLAGAASFMGTNVAGLIGGGFALGASALVSAFVGTGAVSTSGSAAASVEAESPTWSDAPNPVAEGGCWPVIYGTALIKPVCISWYKEYDGEDQYLNWLGAIADHEIDSISGVTINGNPLEFYDNVQTEIRTGTLNQEPVSFFKKTVSEKSVNMRVGTDWITARTDGNACQGLGYILCFNQGLGYVSDSGAMTSTSVTIQRRYRKVGAADWATLPEETITAATGSPLYKQFIIDDVDEAGAQFDLGVRFVTAPTSGARYRNMLYFVGIQEIVYDEFIYPGRALLGLRIKANDLINTGTSLTVEAVVTRSTVPVWTGSAYEDKPADNPAWAAWDFQHNGDYGGGTAAARIIYEDFSAWAGWLAAKPLYRVNLCMDSVSTHQSWMEQIAMLGRGAVVQLGSKFTCIVDRPEQASPPAQRFLFNVANIRRMSFQESFLSTEDRANCIEVTYRDKDSGYSEQTLAWYGEDYDTSPAQTKATQVKLIGCTSTEQALREAEYRLKKNRYLTNTITFGAFVDAVGVAPGDVVDVGHDVPQWGFGGKVEGSTGNVTVEGVGEDPDVTTATITLDREVTLSPGTSYALQFISQEDDARLEYPVADVDVETTTDTLVIPDGWDENGQPDIGDRYQFGPVGLVSKPFRVLSIQRSTDFAYTLACLEYNEDVYDDAVTVPEVVNVSSLAGVSGLAAVENLVIEGGQAISSVALSWRGVSLSWAVSYRKQGETTWLPLAVVRVPGYIAYNLQADTTYEFKVQAGGESETVSIAFVGLPVPPNVTGFVAVASADGLGTYKWAQADFLLLQGYELRYAAQGSAFDWDSATVLTSVTKGTLVTNSALPPGSWTVGVKAVATGGKYSATAATCDVVMGNSNTMLAQDEQAPIWPGTVTDMVRHHTGVLIPESTAVAADLGWELFDSFVPSPVETCSYESPEIDLDTDVGRARLWAAIDAVLGPGESGSADPTLEVKYRTEGGSYGEWTAWSVGVVAARYVKMRVTMIPATGAAFLRDFVATVDVAPQTETLGPVSVPAGGGAVTFSQEFYTPPKVFPQVVDASSALYPIPSATTKTGCTMHVYDTAGASVGGTIVAQVTT